jgi:hypothetical protein
MGLAVRVVKDYDIYKPILYMYTRKCNYGEKRRREQKREGFAKGRENEGKKQVTLVYICCHKT